MTPATSTTPGRTPTSVRRRPRRPVRSLIRMAFGIAIVAVMLFPLYWMINASLLKSTDLLRTPPVWLPLDGTLDGYRDALATQGRHLLISLMVGFGAAVVSLAVAAPAAYSLAVLRSPGRRTIVFALLIAQMIPGVVMANAMYRIFSNVNLLDTVLALILATSTLAMPFCVLIIRAFMVSIPREMIEAAAIDGANSIRTFVSVVVPISRNALITAALFSFLFAWGDFLFGITLTRSDENTPVTVGIYRFIGAHLTDWNSVMATGVIASIPAAILLVVAQRYVAAGVNAGAIKD